MSIFVVKEPLKMGKEIERKFLVVDKSYRHQAGSSHRIVQGYLSKNADATVRIRIMDNDAFLTVKSRNDGPVRGEWEYRIPVAEAMEMLELCRGGGLIEKTRYRVGRWEIDEFHGAREGLVVAEIELQSADEEIELPAFVGQEVTGDVRYYNSSLCGPGAD